MATTCHLFEFSRGPSKKLREIVEYSLDTFARFTKNTPLGSQTISAFETKLFIHLFMATFCLCTF